MQLAPAMDDARDRADTLRALSNQSAVVDDLMIVSQLRAFTEYEIRHVGIVATDPFDVVFLAQQLRLHAPDVRIFVPSYNALYGHGYLSNQRTFRDLRCIGLSAQP
jgi:hypothetical protein